MSDWDESFDFIVVGSGGGSMCAAVYLRARGKRVLILEKTDLVGGTTAISGGVMWIPDNRFMKDAGVEDSRERAIAYAIAEASVEEIDTLNILQATLLAMRRAVMVSS